MAGHTDGFRSLGELIAGGDPRRGEAAFLEGLSTGSLVRSRNASTESALAQARLRRDEARDKATLRDLAPDVVPTDIQLGLAGQNVEQFSGAALDRQQIGFRDIIANPETARDVRQFTAQAANPSVVDPLQFAGSGGLAVDVFGPDPINNIQTTELGESKLATDRALVLQREQAGLLSKERRDNPDRFKPLLADGSGIALSKQILPTGKGISVIPEGFRAEDAFGAEAFFEGGVNRLSDFFGGGTQFPQEAEASAIMGEVAARIKLALLAETFRPNNRVLTIVEQYAEDPKQIFRGDALGRQNLKTTRVAMERSLLRAMQKIDSKAGKTNTRFGKLEDSIINLADTIADLKAIEASFQRTEGDSDIVESRREQGIEPEAADTVLPSLGETITLPNGDVIRRKD